MNNTLFDYDYDLGVMSEADMLALSETLNMIEPGNGQDAIQSLGSFPFYEYSLIVVLLVLGFQALGNPSD